ncbi:MAG TPA: hypothetical protein VMM56_01425, partial [Planctomycetaceae bacterium]|nr:hypothetical protein [Planctomycetaceae bacterium]
LVQVVGTLRFSRDRDTELNVGVLKVQSSDVCSESGFACDFEGVNFAGEPIQARTGTMPTLEVGTLDLPIPAEFTARIRLHHLPGFDEKDAPALICCSARMELHGSPLSRTWVKLGQDVQAEDTAIVLSEDVSGWNVGDEVIVTGSKRADHRRSYRNEPDAVRTEERKITKIEGRTLHLDKPLKFEHYGSGEFRSEVANLSRSVIVESADPEGVRGHTLYHAYSQGGISYARLAHLGKENLLGRYAIHFHLVGDTMRGSQVLGAAIVDSHNRWITVHGTEYLLVRDCIGYKSVGHGYFMEDGTEVFNLFDRNLGVQAYRGKRLPEQVLPFDPNDGGAFWWANGRNTLVRNVACENDEYGYRYDSQKRSNFDSNLGVRMPDGKTEVVDIRTLPIHRFSHNESHTEGLYGYAFAGTDGVGPDTQHPHQLSDLKAWEVHYALRAQIPTMSIERVQIDHAAYGIYRPWFENHVYRDLHIASTGTEPFNRGLDDESLQHGLLTVDGLTFSGIGYGGQMPLIQISANNVSGTAESHFRGVKVENRSRDDRWPLVNLGGGPRRNPSTPQGVPIYIHDYYGPGRHAKVVSTRAKDLLADGNDYRRDPPLTGDESVAAEVRDVEFPKLHDPIDDIPPATIITEILRDGKQLRIRGTSHDNGEITEVRVNGQAATLKRVTAGVADWEIILAAPSGKVAALGTDDSGNVELTPHEIRVLPETDAVSSRFNH